MRRVLALRQLALGSDNPLITNDLGNLGYNLSQQRRNSEAEPVLKQALALAIQLEPADPSTEALIKSHLALQYVALARVTDAEAIVREAIATLERINGPEHGGLYVPLTALSQALTARFELTEAEATMKRALAITEKANGPTIRSPWRP